MLFSLVYISKAVNTVQEEVLLDILNESHLWNRAHDVTGMLLYLRGPILAHKEGRFVQALEGPEEEVKKLFEMIRRDNRHGNITLLNEGMIKKRNFESWLMGFESLDQEAYKLKPGFFELDDDFLNSGKLQKLSVPLTFMKSFYRMSSTSQHGK
jgi:hypothetical protein